MNPRKSYNLVKKFYFYMFRSNIPIRSTYKTAPKTLSAMKVNSQLLLASLRAIKHSPFGSSRQYP